MFRFNLKFAAATAALAAALAAPAHADILITEVAPWSSGNSAVAADWFELTNTGTSAVNISGWRFDDNSFSFSASVALNGVTSIGAGKSVVFIEGTSVQTNAFINNWFGGSAPAGFAIGTYSGSGIGLSTGGDGVIIFNGTGVQQAKVSFGASPAASPFATFDNAAGLDGVAISTLSVNGVNGAFTVTHAVAEIGSPGAIAAVPEPEGYAMLIAGLGLIGAIARRRKST